MARHGGRRIDGCQREAWGVSSRASCSRTSLYVCTKALSTSVADWHSPRRASRLSAASAAIPEAGNRSRHLYRVLRLMPYRAHNSVLVHKPLARSCGEGAAPIWNWCPARASPPLRMGIRKVLNMSPDKCAPVPVLSHRAPKQIVAAVEAISVSISAYVSPARPTLGPDHLRQSLTAVLN